ncbi:MAG: carbohydrate ABC transporter permease [Devosia sp.]|jgi:raffinose/stachyose/melibiose transport system permease protein|nr:carbohydrate ABC transporter permease [Devosiaceae bacterium]
MFTESVTSTRRLHNGLLLAALTILALLWMLPIFAVISTSLRGQGDLLSGGIFSWPKKIYWDNFVKAWAAGDFSIYFKNSLFVILTKVPLGIAIAALAAYPLAKLRFRLNGPIFLFFLIGLAVPVQVALQPLVVMMRQLQISNTLLALMPPYIAFGLPLQILVLRGFFRLVPNELLEAARVDGASEWRIFWQLMLPLSLPALAALAIIDALATWNEFLLALVLISSKDQRTVPLGLMQFQGEHSSQYTLLMAGVVISIIPVLIIFLFLQRYFVTGLTAGAVKG